MESFQAYCPYCEKRVTLFTLLGGRELERALENDADIEVGHLTYDVNEGDHAWKLIMQEKAKLRKAIAEGLSSFGNLPDGFSWWPAVKFLDENEAAVPAADAPNI